jgi:hypothetical protein
MALATDDDLGTVKVPTSNGLSVSSDGTVSMALATDDDLGTVKVTAGNGLAISDVGVLSMATASASTGSGTTGGSAGAMVGSEKEKLAQYPFKESTPSSSKYLNGTGAWAVPANVAASTGGSGGSAGFMTAADKERLDGIEDEANNYTHPTTDGNKHVPTSVLGDVGKVLKVTGAGEFGWGTDDNDMPTAFTGATKVTAGSSGLVPAPPVGSQGKFLRGDGEWVDETTYSAFTGASVPEDGVALAGASGLVPAPSAGEQQQFLMGDGNWENPLVGFGVNRRNLLVGGSGSIVTYTGYSLSKVGAYLYLNHEYTLSSGPSNCGDGCDCMCGGDCG